MNAKEMFEKLGYEVTLSGDSIIYRKKLERCTDKEVWFQTRKPHYFTRIKHLSSAEDYATTEIELHQAITQQMKELGWIE